ncbi:type III secretion system chaperone [Thalassomonas viridans]|uniref:Type III secretion system chaperone n=1 Tax=Thalassomonas viridans TaxID=137584 RepID=A0AAF0CDK0_9GAMM|nr:type III secretion system chaperone [Thalassomonas viridans]WDE08881.1 type III secretion system chaperone [Thalassomonas viridans]
MKSLEVLAQFYHELGVGELALDQHGRSSIKIESDMILTFELDIVRDQIELIAIVLKGPFADKEALFSRLLSENFRSNLAGARLALDSAQGQVLLCQTLVTEHISHAHFELAVARFVSLYEGLADIFSVPEDVRQSSLAVDNASNAANESGRDDFAGMPFGMIQA